MKPDDYLSKERFPLTTQGNLTLAQQMQIDAFNHDSLAEAMEHSKPLTDDQLKRLNELNQKVEAFPAMREYLRTERGTQGQQRPSAEANPSQEPERGPFYLTQEQRDEVARKHRHLLTHNPHQEPVK